MMKTFFVALLLGLPVLSVAQSPVGEGQNPVIKAYGQAFELDNTVVPLKPEREYRLLFNVTQWSPGSERHINGLERAARLVNLAGMAGVPAGHLHIAVVVSGPAAFGMLDNAAYRERFDKDNVNLGILQALREAGVQVLVCSQTLANLGMNSDVVAPGVEVAVAAMTVQAEYQMDGYVLMPE